MSVLLGAIADDFTGATDLANTLVKEGMRVVQVKAGYLSPEQARTHPLKSVVTRAVGGDHQVEVDRHEVPVDEGDLFLVCSDGLTTMLTDEEIVELLRAQGSLEDHCQQLVGLANDKGGVDNITVVLVEVTQKDRTA